MKRRAKDYRSAWGTTLVLWVCLGAQANLLAAGLPASQEQSSSANRSFVMVGDTPEYRVGPTDILRVTVWNGLEMEETTLRVAEDGTVFVPMGVNHSFHVSGLPSSEVKRLIREEALKYFREVVVQVIVEQHNSSRAYLLGAINDPGLHPLQGRKRVLEFIIEHGGFAERANITRVQINRPDGQVLSVNLSDVIFQGDERQNVIVNPGDIVWIPPREVGANTYFVLGEVRDPGVVTAQGELSIVEAISHSGGFGPDGSTSNVFIARGSLDEPEVIQVDLERLVKKADFSQNVALRDNDVIFVPRRGLARYREVIQVISPLLGVLRDTVFLLRIN